MSTEPLRIQIQKTIRSLILSAPAYEVTYDRDLIPTINPDAPTICEPPEILVNEIEDSWEIDEDNRRQFQQKRREWLFVAKVKWSREVSVELIDEALAQSPTALRRLAREEDDGSFRRALLLYRGKSITHPTTNRPTGGSQAEFRFSVLQHPF